MFRFFNQVEDQPQGCFLANTGQFRNLINGFFDQFGRILHLNNFGVNACFANGIAFWFQLVPASGFYRTLSLIVN